MYEIQRLLSTISVSPASKEELRLTLSLIDLTSLEETDHETSITALCAKAKKYQTAAICIYPVFVSVAKRELSGTKIKVASVAGGFPLAKLPLASRLHEVKYALNQGADEIDMVISYRKFLQGDHNAVREEIATFKKLCGTKTLKVILETGQLLTQDNILQASRISIDAGADFLKTSTGKIPVNATPESVCVMLEAIKASGKKIGIKPSGGIADTATAVQYLRLTEKILGREWLQPALFRFGASRLADAVHSHL